jgi:hypothetical protein
VEAAPGLLRPMRPVVLAHHAGQHGGPRGRPGVEHALPVGAQVRIGMGLDLRGQGCHATPSDSDRGSPCSSSQVQPSVLGCLTDHMYLRTIRQRWRNQHDRHETPVLCLNGYAPVWGWMIVRSAGYRKPSGAVIRVPSQPAAAGFLIEARAGWMQLQVCGGPFAA